jgi:hypothetical protein
MPDSDSAIELPEMLDNLATMAPVLFTPKLNCPTPSDDLSAAISYDASLLGSCDILKEKPKPMACLWDGKFFIKKPSVELESRNKHLPPVLELTSDKVNATST